MMPECCEKCKHQKKENCAYFKQCAAWTSWFRRQWNGIRTALTPAPKEEPKENRAKSSSTSSLCLYTTDPCGAMEYKKGERK